MSGRARAAVAAPAPRWSWRLWAVWLAVLAAATLLLVVLRGRLERAHIVLVYLLIVLGGSAAAGRWLGITLSGLAFICFNYFFLQPYYTLVVENPLDWLILAAFLVTGIVAAQLLDRAQERAEVARQRAVEVEHLAALGAETLNAGRAEEALAAVIGVIRSTLGVARCEILGPDVEGAGEMPAAGGTSARDDGRTLLVPLVVRGRTVGVLRLADDAPIVLEPPARQFLAALAYYAALGVERVRLVAEAERAEAFREADALKTALIATVSHDLRTPLTTIKALAHRLAERGEEDALSIEEESDRLERFVADLLDLSRLSAGALPLRVELNAVDELIGAAVDRVRGALGEREVRIVRDEAEVAAEPILFGRFDLVQSLRVLANLFENAIKYAPPDAPIDVLVRRVRDGAADRLRITVADRGPGVPRGEERYIFEPFYRPKGARPDVGGAGLGLAIARGLAEAQGGRLEYAPRDGGGSLFTLELSAATPPVLHDDATLLTGA